MDVPLVYKMSLNNNRFYAPFILNTGSNLFKLKGAFDTGARFTCIPIKDISNPAGIRFTGITGKLAGCVESAEFDVSEAVILQCIIGNIDLGKQQILITRHKSVKECVIGMDLLQHIDFMYSASKKILAIRKSTEALQVNQTSQSTITSTHNTTLVTRANVIPAISSYLRKTNNFSEELVKYIINCMPDNLSMSVEEFNALLQKMGF